MDIIKNTIIGVIVISGILSIIWLCSGWECTGYHTETQIEMPLGVVVGGSQYGGGISVPLGNARQVEKQVCNEWIKN